MLTIGFARRVPSYKRLTLMLRDPERLKRLLLHPERPVQLVIAGKSHPADEGGKKLIQEIVRFADDPEVRHRIVFLPNYDIAMAQPLYPGCDVWLNNPLRPYEACGTSGMKAALNGGLNLSILDGWWDEWYDGNNGWAIPSADGVDDPDRRDDIEADRALRPDRERGRAAVLRRRRRRRPGPLDRDGPAHAEVARPQGARRPDGPRLRRRSSTARRPHELARARTATTPARSELAEWKQRVRAGWPAVRVDHVESSGVGDAPEVGDDARRCARSSSLGELSPDDVDVQVVHGRITARGRPGRHHGRVAGARRDLRGRPAPVRGHGRARRRPARSATPSGCCPKQRAPRLARRAGLRRAAARVTVTGSRL